MKRPPKDKSAATSLFSAVRQVLETDGARIGLNELSNEIVEILMEQQSQKPNQDPAMEAARNEAKITASVARMVVDTFVEQGLTADQGWEFFMNEMKFDREKRLRGMK